MIELARRRAEARVGALGALLAAATLATACERIAGIEERHAESPSATPDASLEAPVTCANYCGLVMSACTGEGLLQYANMEECQSFCEGGIIVLEGTPSRSADDDTSNSFACRRSHAADALRAAEADADALPACAYAGPSGGGRCGSACESQCNMAHETCHVVFHEQYGEADDALALSRCDEDCRIGVLTRSAPDGEGSDLVYTVAEGERGGDTLQCRTYHLVRAALIGDDSDPEKLKECGIAVRGAGACAEP